MSNINPIKLKLAYHLGEVLAEISRARRGSLRLKLLKVYATGFIKILNFGS